MFFMHTARAFSLYLSLAAVMILSLGSLSLSVHAQESQETEVIKEVQLDVSEAVQALPTVNVNSADAMAMAKTLKGVGVKKAEAIVRYREVNGNFTSINDLLNVKGIGKSILNRNKDIIVI